MESGCPAHLHPAFPYLPSSACCPHKPGKPGSEGQVLPFTFQRNPKRRAAAPSGRRPKTSGRWRKARTTKVCLGLGLGHAARSWWQNSGLLGPRTPAPSPLLSSGPRKGEEEEWAPAEKISE